MPGDETEWVLIRFDQCWDDSSMDVIALEAATREEAVEAAHGLWRREHATDKVEAPVSSWRDDDVLLVQWDGEGLPFDQWAEAATAEHAAWLEGHDREKAKRKLARLKVQYEALKAKVEGR